MVSGGLWTAHTTHALRKSGLRKRHQPLCRCASLLLLHPSLDSNLSAWERRPGLRVRPGPTSVRILKTGNKLSVQPFHYLMIFAILEDHSWLAASPVIMTLVPWDEGFSWSSHHSLFQTPEPKLANEDMVGPEPLWTVTCGNLKRLFAMVSTYLGRTHLTICFLKVLRYKHSISAYLSMAYFFCSRTDQ